MAVGTRTATRPRYEFSDQQMVAARALDILALAQQEGFELKKDTNRTFMAKHSGGLTFFIDTNTWYCHTTEQSGDTIKFIQEYRNADFVDAVKYLLGQTALPAAPIREYEPPPKKELYLPYKAENNRAAYAYLVKTRGIDPDIVGKTMNQGKIYQGRLLVDKEAKKYETVCAFVGLNDEGKPGYCSMRGVTPGSDIKRDKTGSDKRFAFCMEGKSNRLFVLEAPIEALAHATLTKLNGGDWTQDHRLPLGGMSSLALERYLEKHPNIDTIIFGLNNDYDKFDKDGNPENRGQIRAKKLAEIYSERGFMVKNQVSVNVDFDDDLMCYRRHGSVFREHETPATQEQPGPETASNDDEPEWGEDEWLP